MAELEVIQPNKTNLRKKAEPVRQLTPEIQTLINDMIETMRAANGVGLAAPQVNRSLRLAVIETPPEVDEEGNEIEGTRNLYVVLNPEITWKSRKIVDGVEGCLSIPGYLGEVSRHEAIRVRGMDRNGRNFNLRLKDWDARIFQHEIDHLDGILYIDRLTDPDNFWTEEEFQALFGEEAEEQEAFAAD
jgi:peptide deformylase